MSDERRNSPAPDIKDASATIVTRESAHCESVRGNATKSSDPENISSQESAKEYFTSGCKKSFQWRKSLFTSVMEGNEDDSSQKTSLRSEPLIEQSDTQPSTSTPIKATAWKNSRESTPERDDLSLQDLCITSSTEMDATIEASQHLMSETKDEFNSTLIGTSDYSTIFLDYSNTKSEVSRYDDSSSTTIDCSIDQPSWAPREKPKTNLLRVRNFRVFRCFLGFSRRRRLNKSNGQSPLTNCHRAVEKCHSTSRYS